MSTAQPVTYIVSLIEDAGGSKIHGVYSTWPLARSTVGKLAPGVALTRSTPHQWYAYIPADGLTVWVEKWAVETDTIRKRRPSATRKGRS